MKKQAYSTPQMKVIRLKRPVSVLLTTSNISSVHSKSRNDVDDVGIEWGDGDDSGEAI